jgi:hypothetical protein
MDDHSCLFAVFFLEFRVSGFRINFFNILCTFSEISIALGGVVVVLWSSGGGCYVACRRAQKLRHAQKPHRARYQRDKENPTNTKSERKRQLRRPHPTRILSRTSSGYIPYRLRYATATPTSISQSPIAPATMKTKRRHPHVCDSYW